MPATSEELIHTSPLREPDWRWRRAGELAARPRVDPAREDPATLRVAAYRRAVRAADTPAALERAAAAFPDVHTAWELHEAGGPAVVELQARLLAGQTPAAAAARVGLASGVAGQYERQHFQVTDGLGSSDWVVMCVARLPLVPDRRAVATSLLLRLAYAGGPPVVDAAAPLLAGDLGWLDAEDDPAAVDARVRAAVRQPVRIEEISPFDPDAAVKLLDILADVPGAAAAGRGDEQPDGRGSEPPAVQSGGRPAGIRRRRPRAAT